MASLKTVMFSQPSLTLTSLQKPGYAQGRMSNCLAYGDCARSTSGSQNLGVLPKRHDNSHILRS